MRYKVTIAAEYVASNVADTVSKNHGSWDHATDQVRGYGVVFITANHGEDNDLTDAMDDHAGVIEYEGFNPVDPQFTISDDQWLKVLDLRKRVFVDGN